MLFSPRFTVVSTLFLVNTAIVVVQATPTCVRVGQTATASWVNAQQEQCTWTGLVGSNFGINTANNGNYGCNGRCGEGCDGVALGNA